MDSKGEDRKKDVTKVTDAIEKAGHSRFMSKAAKKQAERMTAAQKKHRARKAAAARWGLPAPEPEEDVPLPRRLF